MHNFLNEIYNKVTKKAYLDSQQVLDYIINNYEDFTPNWHALGFIHCKLMDLESGTLRLHIWESQEKHPEEQSEKIHDHLFSLNSLVISGKIRNEFFEVFEAKPHEFTHYAYIVKYANGYSYLTPNDKLYKLYELSKETITKGEYYSIHSSDFHRSSLTNKVSALTLVATYGHLEKDPITLSTIQLENNKPRNFLPYDKQKWRDALVEFRTKLNTNPN